MDKSLWMSLQPFLAQGMRDLLRTVGMGLATHGVITTGATGVEAFVGAGMTLAGIFWGWWTTSGYLQVGALLKKLTATHTDANAVKAAQVLPPAAAVDTQAKSLSVQSVTDAVAKILLVAFVLSAFLANGQAQAQAKLTGNIARDIAAATTPKSSAPAGSVDGAVQNFADGVQKIEKALVDKGIADLQAAITDATNHKDAISLPCWQANLALLQSLPSQWDTPPSPIGIALGIQIQRDLLNSITGNDAGSLKVACAALLGDQLKIVANLGALIGVRIASGGLL